MEACIVCDGTEWTYAMNAHGLTYFCCENCGLVRLYPQPSAKTIAALEASAKVDAATEEVAARERALTYWRHFKQQLGAAATARRILLLSAETESLVKIGRELGFERIAVRDSISRNPPEELERESFDGCMAVFGIERLPDPADTLQRIWDALKPEGKLLLVMPLIDTLPAKFCGGAWTELRPENQFFFDRNNIQSALLRYGFNKIWVFPDWRRYTLHHLKYRAGIYPRTRLTTAVALIARLVPRKLMTLVRLFLPSSAAIVTASKAQMRARRKVSIVMPAYNEISTFADCFSAVSRKQLDGIDKEIIVIESNSSDGTRELVQELCRSTGTRLILQERAAGKGNAVRAGLEIVTGDIVLIQDADLEYDVNDYDALLKPILHHKSALVLGSRHTGSWKLRKFNDQPGVALFFNLGHVLFRSSLNLLFQQSLKDPFTMYKVFRTDCLYGLRFESNRFDFDFEILIKLLRKGYRPLELPVNYQARSLAEGKKISALRDPFTWIRALAKYRFQRIEPLQSMGVAVAEP